MKRTANMRKRRMITKKICKHDVCWREVKMSSGRRVISRRAGQWMKKANQASLLSVASSHYLKSKEVIEVKGSWVKVRVTIHHGLRSRGPRNA